MRQTIRDILKATGPIESIQAAGWVRTRRDSKAFSFLELNDGSCLGNLQIIADVGIPGSEDLAKMSTGASVSVVGKLVPSQGGGQAWEVQATAIRLIGAAPDDFPLQKKGHSTEFLRSIGHLRPRTNLYGAMFRVRSRMSFAIHRFFQERGFHYIHTPIITASDCEGAGEMFRVTTLDPTQPTKKSFDDDFFGK
ncbi:MAG: asparagine--tRNA ligase, partial [Verrucomicrobiales bacterium VVV1]